MGVLSAGLIVTLLCGVSIVGGALLGPYVGGSGFGTARLAAEQRAGASAALHAGGHPSRRPTAAAATTRPAGGRSMRTAGRPGATGSHTEISAGVDVHAGPAHRHVGAGAGSSDEDTIELTVHTPVADATVKLSPPVRSKPLRGPLPVK